MSKDKAAKPEIVETPTTPTIDAPPASTEKPKATKEEIKAMVAKYVKADADVLTAKAMFDKAMEVRGEIAKEIYVKSGKGKYSVGGEIMTLMSRSSKKSGKESYFFKGQNDDEVIGGD